MVNKIFPLWRAAPVAAIAFGVLTLGLDLAVVPLDILTHKTGPGGPVDDGLSTAAVVVPEVKRRAWDSNPRGRCRPNGFQEHT